MKKRTLIASLCMIFAFLLSNPIHAQKFSGLDKSPMDAASYPSDYKISDKLVKIIYSRPQLNERPLEKLAPSGKVWRTGANEAAEITFYKDVTFGDKKVKAGTYTFFAIPGEKEWIIILSKDINVWGAYSYNESNNVIKVSAPVSAGESLEAFSIAFADDGTMHLGWGTTRVAVLFSK